MRITPNYQLDQCEKSFFRYSILLQNGENLHPLSATVISELSLNTTESMQ